MHTDKLTKILHTLMCDAFDMEKQIKDALPDMKDAANNPALTADFEQFTRETEQQINRLKQAHKVLDMDIKDVSCKVTKQLIDEGEILFKGAEEGPVRDAALIIAAQKTQHLGIASYGSMVALARTLGHREVAHLLETSLNEEKAADERLTQLAMENINQDALKEAA